MDSVLQDAKTIEQPRNRVWQWVVERLGLRSLHYEMPEYAQSFFYFLGGITLGGIIILFITGFYLALFYNPVPAEARDSIINIVTSVRLGEFARSVHWWAANLVIVTATLHLVRVFITASYKRPRELNWVIGVIMFLLIVVLFFTGTMLKWDQEGYEASRHLEEVAEMSGWVGAPFTSGFSLGVPLLTRISFVHVAVLPAILILLVGAHLLLVKLQKISPRPVREERSAPSAYTMPKTNELVSYFDLHLRRLTGYVMLLAALITVLALAMPALLGGAVIPGREITKPPALLWWLIPFENWWGVKALFWVAVIVPIALLVIPFFDRAPFRHILNRKWALALGIIVVLVLTILTFLGWLSPTAVHVD